MSGSSDAVGSSSSRISGSLISDLASATRVFWPDESLPVWRSRKLVQVELIGQRPDAAGDVRAAVEHAEHIQVLPHGEPHRHIDIGAFEVHPVQHAMALARHRGAKHGDLPERRLNQAHDGRDGRGLAGAVAAEQRRAGAGLDGKRDAVHRGHGLVALDQAVDGNREIGRGGASMPRRCDAACGRGASPTRPPATAGHASRFATLRTARGSTKIRPCSKTPPTCCTCRSGETSRLDTLLRLRWLAIIGQTIAVLVVYYAIEFPLPVWPASRVIALSAWLNVALRVRFSLTQRLEPERAAWLLAFDIAELAVLLFLTGGLENPFAFLFLAPVLLSATALPPRITIMLGAFAVVCATVLVFAHYPLPWDTDDPLELPWIYLLGVWLSILLAIGFIGVYAIADHRRGPADRRGAGRDRARARARAASVATRRTNNT